MLYGWMMCSLVGVVCVCIGRGMVMLVIFVVCCCCCWLMKVLMWLCCSMLL